MNFTTSLSALNANMGAFGIIATILAIIATVAAFILVVPESKREKLGRFGKFLHDAVNFKFLIVEKILQALYIFVTAYLILCGFFMLFMAPETWTGRHWLGGYGILLMVLGPIAVRLCYELLMMAVLLLKNVISINRKLKTRTSAAPTPTCSPCRSCTVPSPPSPPLPWPRWFLWLLLSRKLPPSRWRPASAPAAALIWMRMATAPTAIRSKLLLESSL